LDFCQIVSYPLSKFKIASAWRFAYNAKINQGEWPPAVNECAALLPVLASARAGILLSGNTMSSTMKEYDKFAICPVVFHPRG